MEGAIAGLAKVVRPRQCLALIQAILDEPATHLRGTMLPIRWLNY